MLDVGRSRSLLAQDMALYSAAHSPSGHDDGGTYEQDHPLESTPNFSPAIKNPFLPSTDTDAVVVLEMLEKVDSVLSGNDEPNLNATIEIDLISKEGESLRSPDVGVLAVDDGGPITESMIDMSKFPAKNDL